MSRASAVRSPAPVGPRRAAFNDGSPASRPGWASVGWTVGCQVGGWLFLVLAGLAAIPGEAAVATAAGDAAPGAAGSGRSLRAAWQDGNGFRWLPLGSPGTGSPGFEAVRADAGRGIAFTNRVSAAAALNNQILENGAGVALGDVDGDGWCDVYLCGSEPANALFRNLGDWRFAEVTAEAGVACERQFSTGAVFADLDGDRDLDLLVNGLGVGTRLFRNDGRGRFTEEAGSGLDRRSAATSLAVADVDRDGDLDLYVATYRVISARSEVPSPRIEVRQSNGRLVVSPADRFLAFPLADGRAEIAEKGEADRLYLNDGAGHFREVSWTGGTFLDEDGRPLREPPEDWSLSVLFRDLDGDGAPDLYVCNDFFRSRDRFWRNDGSGRFRAVSPLAWRTMSLSSMAADAGDLDRDGRDDFVVLEMLARDHRTRQRQRANAFRAEQALPFADPAYQPEVPRTTVFRARDDGTFAEIGQYAGLAATDWTWSAALVDIDLDGWDDLLAATGNQHDVLDLDAQGELDRAAMRGPVRNLEFYRPLPQRMLAFRNRGDLTFEETGERWGLTEPGVAQGLALADLDGDGDLDAVVNRLDQPAVLLRNRTSAPRLAVRLRGRAPNTGGIGARVVVTSDPAPGGAAGRPQTRVVTAGGRYLSSDEAGKVFALPLGASRLSVEVRWPGGGRSVVGGVEPGRLIEIDQPAAGTGAPAGTPAIPATAASGPLFTDVSDQLGHRHRDAAFNDFARQPLLPHSLSRLGPGLAWGDLDGDGWEDLIVAGGTGGQLAVLRNDSGRGFVARTIGSPVAPLPVREQTAPVVWRGSGRDVRILVGSSSYEEPQPGGAAVLTFDPEAGRWEAAVPSLAAATGPLALADVDADGDLDLFVGGRCLPGRFPLPAPSAIHRNDGGRFVPDPEAAAVLGAAGLVAGAVFSDLDADGDPDLVLACEWGPLRVFRNERGRWTEVTGAWGLDAWTGCWAGVIAGDFDGDGRLDLAASNLGLNTRHRWEPARPWRLYAGDFSGGGGVDVIEACAVPALGAYAPWRSLDVLGRAIPGWVVRFPTLRAFAETPIEGLLGEALARARVLEAATLEHRVFLNRGGRFESRPLPAEAQWAPGFGLAVADFDGDGREDLFLAQNWFDFDLDSARADAGTGLCLLGDGAGGFRPLGPRASGVFLAGQQRGVAVGDFDHDGRVDLAVTQNDEPTRLLRNAAGVPGVRVRLRGSAANPDGIGAWLQVVAGGQPGPVREVRAGGGYLSADSVVQVLARPPGEARLRVRWPGGRLVEVELPAGLREVTVDASDGER